MWCDKAHTTRDGGSSILMRQRPEAEAAPEFSSTLDRGWHRLMAPTRTHACRDDRQEQVDEDERKQSSLSKLVFIWFSYMNSMTSFNFEYPDSPLAT